MIMSSGDKDRSFKSRLSYLKPYLRNLLEPVKIVWKDPLGRVGTTVFFAIILIALFAPLLATHNPHKMNERIEGSVINFSEPGQWEGYEIIGDSPLNDMAASADIKAAVTEKNELLIEQNDGGWQQEEIIENGEDFRLNTITVVEDEIMAAGTDGYLIYHSEEELNYEAVGPGSDINSIASSPQDDILAVGDEGLILNYEEGDWQELESGTDQNLNSVDFSAAGDAVIVGEQGTILQYAEGEIETPSYRDFGDETFRDLLDVDYHDSDIAFAVGERGTTMGFDGSDWYSIDSGTSRELRGVEVFDREEAYAVGYHGVMQHFDGDSWTSLERISNRSYRGIESFEGVGYIFGVDPYVNELSPPSRDHYFGTTHLGRDIFSQVIYGSRTALMVGIIAAIMVNGIGFTVGLISGYFGGKIDSFLMRVVDVMYGMPLEPFAIVLVLIFDPGLWIIILAIGLLTWRTNARGIRSQVLSLAERPFVKAARVAGASNLRIMAVHIAPNVLPLAFLQLAVAMGYAITAEATLSFLGLGPPRLYSWGTILHSARLSGAWRTAWWWIIPPGIFISATVVSVFLISRAVEVWTNPRLRGGNENAPEPEESEDILPHGQQEHQSS